MHHEMGEKVYFFLTGLGGLQRLEKCVQASGKWLGVQYILSVCVCGGEGGGGMDAQMCISSKMLSYQARKLRPTADYLLNSLIGKMLDGVSDIRCARLLTQYCLLQ